MLTRVPEVCSEILLQVNVLMHAVQRQLTLSNLLFCVGECNIFFSKMSSFAVHQKKRQITGLSQDGEGVTCPTLPLIG